MKILYFFIIIIGLSTSCDNNSEQSNNTQTKSKVIPETESIVIPIELEESDGILDSSMSNDILVNNEEVEKWYLWYNFKELDTILKCDSINVHLSLSDTVKFENYFKNQGTIDSLAKKYQNSHKFARAVESFLLQSDYGDIFRRDSTSVKLLMDDGSWFEVRQNIEADEYDNTFENYYHENGYYSLRTQWYEGNGYKLVNDKTKSITRVLGRTYISPNGGYFLAIEYDILAGYNVNGFQLLKNKDGILYSVCEFYPEKWGFTNVKWLSDTILILESNTVRTYDNKLEEIKFYTKLEIE